MAKVKRSTPLEGGTWDLSELGTVQHTSRWGTVARAKGSALRYYPGCPWEKKPKCLPPPPPFYYFLPVLRVTRQGDTFIAQAWVAFRAHDSDQVYAGTTSIGTTCFYGLEAYSASLEIRDLVNGYVLWELIHFVDCADVPPTTRIRRMATPIPGCPRGPVPPGWEESGGIRTDVPVTTSRSYVKDCQILLCPDEPFILVQ